MGDTLSGPSAQERVLGLFLQDLDRAPDRAAVVRDYAARHPDLASTFASLAEVQSAVRVCLPADAAPPPRPLAAGDDPAGVTLGEFTLTRLIAAGGMGEVYEARQARLDRTVAVKVIRWGRATPDADERFRREQTILAQLHQTHIVPIHTSGEAGDVRYFAMAFIPGAPLSRVVDAAYDQETSAAGRTPPLRELVETAPGPGDRPATPRAARDPAVRVRLSAEYFRSVADVMAQAAEAVQYAHDAGVIHRDIKPSNLMVDGQGHCWIIDFGLAGLLAGDERPPPAPAGPAGPADGLTRGPMGTPPYMAPEQFDGRPGFRSDVWGLGATLYELLTLRRAFDGPTYPAIEARVMAAAPRPVRDLVPAAPPDLAAICAKALRRDPADRYPTAGELAADLRRWLRREPTTARPARTLRRVGLWAARNPGWAAAVASAVVLGVGVGVAGYAAAAARAGAAEEKARRADAEAAAAEQRRKDEERGAVLVRAAGARAGERRNGWSAQGWELGGAAAKLRPGPDAQYEAAASLVGLDAAPARRHDTPAPRPDAGAADVAFSPDGRRVLAGGTGGDPGWLWDRATGEEKTEAVLGRGPVGFLKDGTPVQAVFPADDRTRVHFRDVAAGKTLRTWEAGPGVGGATLSADAGLLAVAAGGEVAVWDTVAGKLVRRVEAAGVTALAFAPDGKLLAVGDADGRVACWPLPAGDRLPPLACGRTAVSALALGRNVRPPAGGEGGADWRLAAGDAGGTIQVWDLARREVLSHCRGSQHGVHAVAFSPDGMTLASAGRMEAKLWDVATGRHLLELVPPPLYRNTMTGVAFAPDGSHLAVGSVNAHGAAGGVDVWKLQNGRGVRTLRGLRTQLSRLAVSADGTRVAGLSHDWQVAVWDAAADRLLWVFDAPRGYFADNAGLAFGPDARRLVFSAGREAVRWDMDTGAAVDRWPLPPGMSDAVVVHPDGKVYLFRAEVTGGKYPPLGNTPPRDQFPRVCPVRELVPGGKLREVREPVTDFRAIVQTAAASADGRYFVVQGWDGVSRDPGVVRAYDSATGAGIGAVGPGENSFALEPTGKLLLAPANNGRGTALVGMPSGKPLGVRPGHFATWFGPGAELGAAVTRLPEPDFRAMALIRAGSGQRLAAIDTGTRVRSFDAFFSRDGNRLVWGNEDGSVMVCDLPEVNRRLTELGLGW